LIIAQFDGETLIPLPAGHESFVRIVTSAGALSAGVPDSNQKNLRALRAFAVHSFFLTARCAQDAKDAK
jgi:hypothetical protein